MYHGKEVEYALEKAKFNSLYGMSVTNNIKDEVEYDNDIGWMEVPISNDKITSLNKSPVPLLPNVLAYLQMQILALTQAKSFVYAQSIAVLLLPLVSEYLFLKNQRDMDL